MKPALAAIVAATLMLTACDQVSSASDKASVCAEALGLTNLNPNLDPSELAAQAQDKANRLRELANQASDQDLKQNLVTIADSYVALEQRRAAGLSDVNDWVQRNADNLGSLRAACF
ncbi:hypothetical protein [Amycolatopsis sp. GM8]|uniref:hypothetical protein n=1 Tax=Amycolatopsis sp. GM8 TaxID=2896530 RepID=UPI001F3C7931|nr:hypothetical protein [Amycolatopsis sp. GM8]